MVGYQSFRHFRRAGTKFPHPERLNANNLETYIPRSQLLGDQHQILQTVVNTDAILMNDTESRFNVTAVAFPKEILDVDTRGAAIFIFVSVSENGGTAAILVDLRSGLEGEGMNEADVTFVEEGIFGLHKGKNIYCSICCCSQSLTSSFGKKPPPLSLFSL